MRRRNAVMIAALALVLCSGCTKIDYVGRSYPPTTHVDIFFAMEDVKRAYEVMGHMVAHADDIVSAEKMQKKIIEKAQEKGADAVVILGLERYRSGEKSEYTQTTDEDDGKVTVKSKSSTDAEYEKEISATLLRYK